MHDFGATIWVCHYEVRLLEDLEGRGWVMFYISFLFFVDYLLKPSAL
jgi:hypothetical protein